MDTLSSSIARINGEAIIKHSAKQRISMNKITLQCAAAPLLTLAVALSLTTTEAQERATPLPPTDVAGLRWTNAFFPGAHYRSAVPTGDSLLCFPIG